MDLSALANVTTALAVIAGLIFGVIEVRRARREREERAAFEVVHALMTDHWISSAPTVRAMDETISPEALRTDQLLLRSVHSVAFVLEALGYAVYKRHVPLDMVDELFGGSIRVAWRKLQPYTNYERQITGSKKSWEWFQWLAELLNERRGPLESKMGAYELHRSWQ